jgi:hypothetical protein
VRTLHSYSAAKHSRCWRVGDCDHASAKPELPFPSDLDEEFLNIPRGCCGTMPFVHLLRGAIHEANAFAADAATAYVTGERACRVCGGARRPPHRSKADLILSVHRDGGFHRIRWPSSRPGAISARPNRR